jgi:hypothetical protein
LQALAVEPMNASQCRLALKFPREALQAGRTPDEGSQLIADELKFRLARFADG